MRNWKHLTIKRNRITSLNRNYNMICSHFSQHFCCCGILIILLLMLFLLQSNCLPSKNLLTGGRFASHNACAGLVILWTFPLWWKLQNFNKIYLKNALQWQNNISAKIKSISLLLKPSAAMATVVSMTAGYSASVSVISRLPREVLPLTEPLNSEKNWSHFPSVVIK